MLRILHIDDDPNDLQLFEEAVRECRLPVDRRTAMDGREGLEHLRSFLQPGSNWRPDLIVCDLHMPRMDGLAFLQALKDDAATRHIPVIMLTSSQRPHDIADAYDRQVCAFVSKPIDFSLLCDLVKRTFEFWGGAAELPRREAS